MVQKLSTACQLLVTSSAQAYLPSRDFCRILTNRRQCSPFRLIGYRPSKSE